MSEELATSASPKKRSFLREGWLELRRKLERRTLRSNMAQQDRARNAALANLGQKAREADIDLSEFADLSTQIEHLEAQTGELSSAAKKIEGEKAAMEEKRRGEVARFDAQRKTQDELKRQLDAALRELNQKQSAQEREVQRMESRLAAIANELAAIEKQAATTPTPGQAPQTAALDAKREQLLTEQAQHSVAIPQIREALLPMGNEVERLKQEIQRCTNEITKVKLERKAALAQVDASLNHLCGELRATGDQSTAVGKNIHNCLVQLGQGVYEKRNDEPALANAVQEVKNVDGKLAAAAGSLNASVAQTQAMPRGTMAKFALTLVGTPFLVIGLIYGGLFAWEYTRPDVRVETPKPVNRYLQHSLKSHPAYLLANQLAEAKNEQEVADRMREAFQKIHLGIYTADGRQILAGAERSEKDIFLYDFQLKILARSFYLRNGMVFANHSRMLGKALLELENPSELEPALAEAVGRRYQEAIKKPDDPMNFLILLVDGLARQQVKPYSLDKAHRFSQDRPHIDSLQSFLIMLDFFTHPPAAPSTVSLDWVPSLVTTAYAQTPCDAIKGDDNQGYWGRGTDIFTEVGQAIPGIAGNVVGMVGNATGVTGAIGDLLVLYGMTIKLTPQPYLIHLLHNDNSVAGIEATVTFDGQGVPDSVLKCGWLAGKQMPSNGGLKDVDLTWDFYPTLQPHLEMHREMWYGYGDKRNILTATAGGFRTTTDENGNSIFLIQPKDCPDRSGKMLLGQDYMASVNARYVTKSIPTPGLLGFGLILKLGPGAIEFLMSGRSGYARFRAEWHEKIPEEPQYDDG